MIALGIDPGIERTGIGVIEYDGPNEIHPIWYGLITTDKRNSHVERLETLDRDLKELLMRFHPDIIGIEELFFTSNQKTAMNVAEARGVISLLCHKQGIKFETFTPNEIKSTITGNGTASKQEVARAVCQILNLSEAPHPDDITDALAIAICTGLNQNKWK